MGEGEGIRGTISFHLNKVDNNWYMSKIEYKGK